MGKQAGCGSQVCRERALGLLAFGRVADPHDCGWMDRGDNVLRELGPRDRLAAFASDTKARAKECLRRGRAEQDEYLRSDGFEFRVEPTPAGGNLFPIRLVVDAALALRVPLEVLDRVRDVDPAAVDAGECECVVEHAAGGPDERAAG